MKKHHQGQSGALGLLKLSGARAPRPMDKTILEYGPEVDVEQND